MKVFKLYHTYNVIEKKKIKSVIVVWTDNLNNKPLPVGYEHSKTCSICYGSKYQKRK